MTDITFVAHVFASIFVILVTILTLTISCELFRHFCVNQCCENSPKFKSVPSDVSVTTNSSRKNSSKSIRRTESIRKIHSFFRYTAIICCVLFCIVCISVSMDRIIWCMHNQPSHASLAYVIWISYFLGRMMLGLIFIGRLHFTFRYSSLAYSRCTINALLFLWCLMPIFGVLSILIIAIDLSLLLLGIVFGASFILIDIALSCVLLYLYLKKLFDLVHEDEQQQNRKFVHLMTRYTLLYVVCFVATFVVLVFLGCSPLFVASKGAVYQSCVWIVVAVDAMLNTLCLWLNFAFAKKWYGKLCSCFHDQCALCCTHCCADTTKSGNKVSMTNIDGVEQKTLKESSVNEEDADDSNSEC